MEDNQELLQLYQELGKAYYEGGFEDPLPQLLPYFDKITAIKNSSQKMVCKHCGAQYSEGQIFCIVCGEKLDNPKIPKDETISFGPITNNPHNAEPSMSKCPNCGSAVGPDQGFCIICGTPLNLTDETEAINPLNITENVCPKCGTPVNEDDRFCISCGAKLEKVQDIISKPEDMIISEPLKLTCPKCGNEANITQKFCVNCGTPLNSNQTPTVSTCPNCGKILEPDDIFCTNCGTKVR